VERPTPDMARCLRIASDRLAGGRQQERHAQVSALHDQIVAGLHGGTSRGRGQGSG
jgi:hypothetical protein